MSKDVKALSRAKLEWLCDGLEQVVGHLLETIKPIVEATEHVVFSDAKDDQTISVELNVLHLRELWAAHEEYKREPDDTQD